MNPRLANIPASATLALNSLAGKLSAEGKDVINLTAGQPDTGTAKHVIDAAIKALEAGQTRYSPVPGTVELRQAIVRYTSTFYDKEISVDQILVSNGAKHSLFNIFQYLLEPGDEVILLSPYWVSYPPIVELSGGKAVTIELDSNNNFALPVEKIKNAINKKTRAILINSPSNPTGAVVSESELNDLASVLANKPITIIVDDIYHRLTFANAKWANPYKIKGIASENLIVVNGVSKTYAMTGFRIGWTIADAKAIKSMGILQGHATSGACTISQFAALQAIIGDQSSVGEMCQIFQRRLSNLNEQLNKISGLQINNIGGAFYAFPNISQCPGYRFNSTNDFCHHLLEEKHVAVVPGEAFGAPGHIRLSFAVNDSSLVEGLSRLSEALS